MCIEAGAHGITAHLREDRRHIVDEDVRRLRALLGNPPEVCGFAAADFQPAQGRHPIFNLEMAATGEMVGIAQRILPNVVTLVPERREERTTEGGLDVLGGGEVLAGHVRALRDAGIKVSLFIAADEAQIEASKRLEVEQIELHTGEYAHAFHDAAARGRELERLARGAALAHRLGLETAAGHGLTRDNVVELVRIPEIEELNIGHAVIADAVFLSLSGAVRAMSEAIARGRPS